MAARDIAQALTTITDDSPYIAQALAQLGFADFLDLTTHDQRRVLVMAACFKLRDTRETWES